MLRVLFTALYHQRLSIYQSQTHIVLLLKKKKKGNKGIGSAFDTYLHPTVLNFSTGNNNNFKGLHSLKVLNNAWASSENNNK